MNGIIKLRSRCRLLNRAHRYFLVSLLSLFLRKAPVFLIIFGIRRLLPLGGQELSAQPDTDALLRIALVILLLLLVPVFLTLSSGIRAGEQYIYYSHSCEGTYGLKALFSFLSPRKAIPLFLLYGRISFLKWAWFIYYSIPVGVCCATIFYLHQYSYLDIYTLLLLSGAGSVLASLSLFMWRITCAEYSAAPYLAIMKKLPYKECIKESMKVTDGFLREKVITDFSFVGWFLLCIFLVPIPFTLVYYKLSDACFTESVVEAPFLFRKTDAERSSM